MKDACLCDPSHFENNFYATMLILETILANKAKSMLASWGQAGGWMLLYQH